MVRSQAFVALTPQFRPLSPLRGTAGRSLKPTAGQDPAAAQRAARDMEGVFLKLLWQEMWSTVGQGQGSFVPGGLAGDIYRDFLLQAYADKTAEAGGIGLATLITSQLKR